MKLVGSLFGVGLIPGAPGTYATAVAFGVVVALAAAGVAGFAVPGLLMLVVAASSILVGSRVTEQGHNDPNWFVLDEVAGYLAAVLFLPFAGLREACILGAVAFVLFRAADIFKPFPIKRIERLPGGWGITLDDIAAGVMANVLTRLLAALTPLGG